MSSSAVPTPQFPSGAGAQSQLLGMWGSRVNEWHTTGIGKSDRRRPTSQRTFTPYFCVNGGTIPFKRRYSTSCP